MRKIRFGAAAMIGLVPLALGMSVAVGPIMSAAAGTSCSIAGTTGLTAAVVASAGQTISGQVIDASGCDIGIFVGPGVEHVTISGATVTGANDHGIFVQDTSHVSIRNSTISGNGVAPHSVAEDKALQLVGTTNSSVQDNIVTGNFADGGIAINDDGSLDPGAPTGGSLLASTNNVVSGNTVSGNYVGCGIVLSAYNPAAGVSNNVVTGNTVTGTVGFSKHGPVIGGIVVAADSSNTTVSNNTVVGNTITDSFIPGIVVHSNAPGDVVSNNSVIANTLSGDGWGKIDGPPALVGIIIASGAPSAILTNTTASANRITNEDIGIYVAGATGTHIGGLPLNQATTPVAP